MSGYIRLLDIASSRVTTIAGRGSSFADGVGSNAGFVRPGGVVLNAEGVALLVGGGSL